jgi:hypothetical protein
LKAALQEIAAIPVPLKSINQMSNEAYVILAGGYCSGVLKCQKIAGKALEGKS